MLTAELLYFVQMFNVTRVVLSGMAIINYPAKYGKFIINHHIIQPRHKSYKNFNICIF